MKRIIIALVLVLATVLSLAACNKEKENENANGDGEVTACEHEMKYSLNDDKKGYTLTGIGNCDCEDVVIPASYKDLPVTAIGERAFFNCQTPKSVTIPESVTQIWHRAFASCRSLERVNIPSSVTGMGFYVFMGCTSLESVTIPASVTYIGGDIFQMCGDGVTVNCEAKSQPKEWDPMWNKAGCTVNWGYTGE